MSDSFGRHQSKRWVRASVPTYGDDWDNEFDYDFDENQEHDSMILEENSSNKNNEEPFKAGKENEGNKQGNLMLTIDRFSNRNDDSDESSDEDPPEIFEEGTGAAEKARETGEMDNTLDFRQISQEEDNDTHTAVVGKVVNVPAKPRDGSFEKLENLGPPTPNFNNIPSEYSSASPTSDPNTQSDSDSIQMEPENLNMKLAEEENKLEESSNFDPHTTEDGNTSVTVPVAKESLSNIDPLVLSIDHRRLSMSDDSDEDSESDVNSKGASWEQSDNMGAYTPGNETVVKNTPEESEKGPHDDILNSLINDLEQASFTRSGYNSVPATSEHDKSANEILPSMSSIHDLSLPDFEHASYDTSFSSDKIEINSEDIESGSHTPIEPLTISHKEEHEKFVRAMTDRQPSIRKPPPMGRQNLVSMDYSNIADAMSDYINSPAKDKQESMANIAEDGDYESDEGGRRIEKDETNAGDNSNKNSVAEEMKGYASSSSSSTGEDFLNDSDKDDDHSVRNINEKEKTSESNPTLSSAQDSFGGDNYDFIVPPKKINRPEADRRVSTASTSTFNLGEWNPNTDNYRDQFINDNDNESNLNFNIEEGENQYYEKFTKGPNHQNSEVASTSSTLSVPDTIDGGLPNIDEETDDDASLSGGVSSVANGSMATDESLIKDPSYSKAAFKEDDESLVSRKSSSSRSIRHQRYSSLIPPMSEEELAESTRSFSHKRSSSLVSASTVNIASKRDVTASTKSSTPTTNVATSRKTSFSKSQDKTPLYSWKEIMSTSQPIDRIAKLKDALEKERERNTGLNEWLRETLKSVDMSSNIHIGKIASEAYQNASHSDIRRHASLRSRVSLVKGKVETSGLQASNLGKKFLNRGKKFIKSTGGGE